MEKNISRKFRCVIAIWLFVFGIAFAGFEGAKAQTDLISGVKVSTSGVTVVGDTIEISPVVGSATNGVEYKYVWSYDNWKEWGVIKRNGKEFSTDRSAKLQVTKAGKYDLYVDARKGSVTTSKKVQIVVLPIISSVETSPKTVYAGDSVTFSPKLNSSLTNVEYKYVWSYEDWKSWGVIKKNGKDFSTDKSAKIRFSKPGKYDLYIDAKRGNVVSTQKKTVQVLPIIKSVSVSPKKVYAGDSVTLSPQLNENRDGLEYKYVWSYENWKSWGVIKVGGKEVSTSKTAKIKISKPGKYEFYVDVKNGNSTVTQKTSVQVLPIISGVNVSAKSVYAGERVTISPKLRENKSGLKFKYVWCYENWLNWGVIKVSGQEFSTKNSVSTKFSKKGKYTLYVDVDNNGTITSSSTTINVIGTKATIFKGMTEAQIVAKIGPLMQEDQRRSGILASVSAAQFILESDYGRSELAQNANNCFGMKTNLSGNTWSGSTWDGVSVYNKTTNEEYSPGVVTTVNASFRKYPYIENSIADHSAYLLGAKNGGKLRYAGLKGCKDYRRAVQIIKDGGYATDSAYVDKVCALIERWNLTKYDLK